MSKTYNKEDVKRESDLTKEFLMIRNNFTSMKDEKDDKILEDSKNEMREIFHELYELRVKLDIYVGSSNEKSIIEGLIEYLDKMRLGIAQTTEK